jgi:hypothetical protein
MDLELKTDVLRLKEMDRIRTIWKNSLLAYVKYYNSERVNMQILKRNSDSIFTGLRVFKTSTYFYTRFNNYGEFKTISNG